MDHAGTASTETVNLLRFRDAVDRPELERQHEIGWDFDTLPNLPEVQTIVSNGPPSARFDMVVLGDGYTDSATFFNDVQTWATELFQSEPYATYSSSFNIHAVYRKSKETGADEPDLTSAVTRDTYYDTTYNVGGIARCLYTKRPTVALRDAGLAPAFDGRPVMFVNNSRYGGCAGQVAVAYNGASGFEVQIHELGHSFGGLADEYDYGGPEHYAGAEPKAPNVTKDSRCAKWAAWIGVDGVDCFEGAAYSRLDIYRPVESCKMRELFHDHCAVCTESIILKAHKAAPVLGAATPWNPFVSIPANGIKTFQVENLVPGGGAVLWYVDGLLKQAGGNTFTYKFGSAYQVVKVIVTDTTPSVRRDPDNVMSASRGWLMMR